MTVKLYRSDGRYVGVFEAAARPSSVGYQGVTFAAPPPELERRFMESPPDADVALVEVRGHALLDEGHLALPDDAPNLHVTPW